MNKASKIPALHCGACILMDSQAVKKLSMDRDNLSLEIQKCQPHDISIIIISSHFTDEETKAYKSYMPKVIINTFGAKILI